ncbi:hypothetical protein COCOBI_01-7320 [Coccomyxa sp. Obi]|nr:hypothetical protein COCOBI_01-7320 [Coccomyxa sp. Obi]
MNEKVKEETSSANHGSSSLGTPAPSYLEGETRTDAAQQIASGAGGSTVFGREDQHEEEANRKDSSAADDLRELAAKGVCAPLWRTNQPVQPGTAEPAVHTLQTGWCFYAGLDAAKRSNVWVANQSPAALAMLAAAAGSPATDRSRPPSESLMQALRGVAEKGARNSTWLGASPTLREILEGRLGDTGPSTPRSPFDNGGGPDLANMQGYTTPEQKDTFNLMGFNSSSTPSTATNIDLGSLPAPLSPEPGDGRSPLGSSHSTPTGNFLAELRRQHQHQGRRSMDDEWAGAGDRLGRAGNNWMDEDFPGAGRPLPTVSDSGARGREQKHSPTHSNISAPPTFCDGPMASPAKPPGASVPQLPEKVMMALVSTPAMFAVPTSINKGFNPPFVLRVGVVSTAPTQIKATVAAYVLQKDQVANLEKWHPAQHVVTESLSGAIVTQTIVCHGPSHPKLPQPSPGKHTGVAEFVFDDLKFHSSSRMKPRWLAFALTLPTDDVLFVQYTVPTIVMSRQCDQHNKAMSILRGQLPWRKRARPDTPGPASPAQPLRATMSAPIGTLDAMSSPSEEPCDGEWPLSGPYTFDRWRDMIERNCKYYSLIRPFDKDDLRMLAKVAGFFSNQASQLVAPFELTPAQWQAFGNWFMSYLRLFRCHQQLWMMRNPTAICGFGVDRARAETLLARQPSGTFLVRPSLSLAGAMVLSVVVDGIIKHMALDGNQLDTRSLEVWVRDVREAVELLDEATGQRTPKEQVYLLHYRRFGVVTDLVRPPVTGAPLHMFSAHHYSLPQPGTSHLLPSGGSLMSTGGGSLLPSGGSLLPTATSISMSTGGASR